MQEVTRTAPSTSDERFRIEVLMLLRGVDWPTASVILHFAHGERYPILDFRALWSLGFENTPRYEIDFWMAWLRHRFYSNPETRSTALTDSPVTPRVCELCAQVTR